MKRRGAHWPFVLAGLLVTSAGANLGLMVVATRDPSFAVEKDYYRKALAWDATMAQERHNEALGWSVALRLVRVRGAAGQARVVAGIADRAGAPLAGARVAVEAFHNARAGHIVAATLAPGAPGRYEATLPLARRGLWELRLRVERGADVFTDVVVRDLEPS